MALRTESTQPHARSILTFSPAQILAWIKKEAGALLLVILALLALTNLPVQLAAVAVFGAILVTLLVIRPVWGLYLLLFAIPYSDIYEVRLGSLKVALTEFMIIGVLSTWALQMLARGQVRLPNSRTLGPWLAYIVVIIFSVAVAWDPIYSIKEILKWLEMLLVYLAFVEMIRTRTQVRMVIALLFLAAVSQAFFGVMQFIFKSGPLHFAGRIYGTFGQPNPFAGYLNTVIPIAIAVSLWFFEVVLRKWLQQRRAYRPPESRRRIQWWPPAPAVLGVLAAGSMVITLAALILSLSRGAWLGLALAVALLAGLWSRRALLPILIGIILVIAIFTAAFLGLLPTEVTNRLSDIILYFGVFDVRTVAVTPENWPVVERMAHWQAGWGMFLDYPILGVGVGNYTPAYSTYQLPGWDLPLDHAHNFYINAAAETGVIGLTAVLILFTAWVREALGALRLVKPPVSGLRLLDRAILLGILSALAAGMFHNVFDNLFVHGIGVQVAVLIGLATVMTTILKQDAATDR